MNKLLNNIFYFLIKLIIYFNQNIRIKNFLAAECYLSYTSNTKTTWSNIFIERRAANWEGGKKAKEMSSSYRRTKIRLKSINIEKGPRKKKKTHTQRKK